MSCFLLFVINYQFFQINKHEKDKVKSNKIEISNFDQSEQQLLSHTSKLSFIERMAYLEKLRAIIHGTDRTEARRDFYNSKIKIDLSNVNS